MTPDELEAAHEYARKNGFDALIALKVNPDKPVDGVGVTCFCQGAMRAPQVLILEPGETQVCRLCGAVFHRFTNNIGVGVRTPKLNLN